MTWQSEKGRRSGRPSRPRPKGQSSGLALAVPVLRIFRSPFRSLNTPITRFLKTPACSSFRACWSFLSSFIPDTIGLSAAFIVRHIMPLLSSSITSEFNSDIGSADFCPRCSVLASFASEVDSSHLFSLYLPPLYIIH